MNSYRPTSTLYPTRVPIWGESGKGVQRCTSTRQYPHALRDPLCTFVQRKQKILVVAIVTTTLHPPSWDFFPLFMLFRSCWTRNIEDIIPELLCSTYHCLKKYVICVWHLENDFICLIYSWNNPISHFLVVNGMLWMIMGIIAVLISQAYPFAYFWCTYVLPSICILLVKQFGLARLTSARVGEAGRSLASLSSVPTNRPIIRDRLTVQL